MENALRITALSLSAVFPISVYQEVWGADSTEVGSYNGLITKKFVCFSQEIEA